MNKSPMTVPNNEIPSHVPPELVRAYPLGERKIILDNPFETLIPEVHEGPEVFFVKGIHQVYGAGWVVRRAEDLRAIYEDNEHFTKKGFSGFAAAVGEDWSVIPTELEPPLHTEFRRALNKLFTPRKMGELDGMVRQRARELIDRFKGQGECDFVQAFSVPFPVMIFLELLGLPVDRMDQFLEWERQLLHSNDVQERVKGVRAVKAYLLEAIEERRRHPADDLITNALNLQVEGRSLTPMEVFGHCFNLYVGGLDTVGTNLGWHFYHLATHPEFQYSLRADARLVKPAIEELLRAYASVTTFRICTKETKIRGVTIKPGDKVAMATPLAGRDPEEYDRPQEVRVDRNPRHLSFGAGIHSCLGLHLARRELTVAMEEMFAAVPPFRVKPGAEIPYFVGGIHHLEALPIQW
jgi:cytochrome P450